MYFIYIFSLIYSTPEEDPFISKSEKEFIISELAKAHSKPKKDKNNNKEVDIEMANIPVEKKDDNINNEKRVKSEIVQKEQIVEIKRGNSLPVTPENPEIFNVSPIPAVNFPAMDTSVVIDETPRTPPLSSIPWFHLLTNLGTISMYF